MLCYGRNVIFNGLNPPEKLQCSVLRCYKCTLVYITMFDFIGCLDGAERSAFANCICLAYLILSYRLEAETRILHVDIICNQHCYKPKLGTGSRNFSWWCHRMRAFSALLAICAGNSPVTGAFRAQRPVTRSFDVIFDLHLNIRLSKRYSKQPWG